MESSFFRVLRNRWLVIVVLAIAGVIVGAAVARSLPPTYQADATLFLKVQSKDSSLYERSQFALQRVKSYSDLVDNPDLLDGVIADLGLDTTAAQLASRVSAINPDSTVLIRVTASAATPGKAVSLTNAVARALSADVNSLENARTDTDDRVDLQLQYVAEPPTRPSSPNVPVIVGLGLLAGLVVGIVVAMAMEAARPRVRTAADVRRATGLPLLAQVPVTAVDQWSKSDRGLTRTATATAATLAGNLRSIGRGTLAPVIALAPALRSSRALKVRVAVARALASTGFSTVLVEWDRATTLSPLGIVRGLPGFAEVLAGTRNVSDVAVRVENGGYDVVPAGDSPFPATVAIERRLPDVIDELAGRYDATVLQFGEDGDPITPSTSPGVLRSAVIVTSYLRTTEKELRGLHARLTVHGIVPLGVVMVDSPSRSRTVDTWTESDLVTIRPAADAPHQGASPVGAEPAPKIDAEPADTREAREPEPQRPAPAPAANRKPRRAPRRPQQADRPSETGGTTEEPSDRVAVGSDADS